MTTPPDLILVKCEVIHVEHGPCGFKLEMHPILRSDVELTTGYAMHSISGKAIHELQEGDLIDVMYVKRKTG